MTRRATRGLRIATLALAASLARAQEPARWTDDDSMLGFFQAVRELSARSVRPASVEQIARESLNAYLRGTDPYARYLGPAEYALVRAAMEPAYGGVGMEVSQDSDGALRCLPYPDGPADRAGVLEGDTLVSVDGTPIPRDEPLLLTGARVRGPVESVVRLGLRRRGEPALELAVARARVRSRTVLPAGTNVWRVLVFETDTARELRDALGKAEPGAAVVLDLRGNPGGSLAAAVEAARLFLAKDAAVVDLRTRTGTTRHAGRDGAPFRTTPFLFLWQDRHTASAAEVFVAALTRNARALSVGQATHGKGVTQRTTELVNGGALVFTDGWLVPPDGKEYDGVGLGPDIPVAGTATVAYRDATRRVIDTLAARDAGAPP